MIKELKMRFCNFTLLSNQLYSHIRHDSGTTVRSGSVSHFLYGTRTCTCLCYMFFMLFCSFSPFVAFRFLRPFFRFQVSFREGCAGPNRPYLEANDGRANDGKAYWPPSLPLGLRCYPTRYSGNGRKSHSTHLCVGAFPSVSPTLLLATRAV